MQPSLQSDTAGGLLSRRVGLVSTVFVVHIHMESFVIYMSKVPNGEGLAPCFEHGDPILPVLEQGVVGAFEYEVTRGKAPRFELHVPLKQDVDTLGQAWYVQVEDGV